MGLSETGKLPLLQSCYPAYWISLLSIAMRWNLKKLPISRPAFGRLTKGSRAARRACALNRRRGELLAGTI